MTAATLYETDSDFRALIQCWIDNRRCPLPMADYLREECSRCGCKVEVAVGEDCIKRRVGLETDPLYVNCPTEHCCGSITLKPKEGSK